MSQDDALEIVDRLHDSLRTCFEERQELERRVEHLRNNLDLAMAALLNIAAGSVRNVERYAADMSQVVDYIPGGQ